MLLALVDLNLNLLFEGILKHMKKIKLLRVMKQKLEVSEIPREGDRKYQYFSRLIFWEVPDCDIKYPESPMRTKIAWILPFTTLLNHFVPQD